MGPNDLFLSGGRFTDTVLLSCEVSKQKFQMIWLLILF